MYHNFHVYQKLWYILCTMYRIIIPAFVVKGRPNLVKGFPYGADLLQNLRGGRAHFDHWQRLPGSLILSPKTCRDYWQPLASPLVARGPHCQSECFPSGGAQMPP